MSYQRNGKFSINEILDQVYVHDIDYPNQLWVSGEFLGENGKTYFIKMNSHRYQCFKNSGLKCVKCGIEGKFFAMERGSKCKAYHFNLYAIDENGKEVLMTKDHIIPKSRGGKCSISNYQTMCYPCNQAKGNKLPEEE